MGLGGLKWVATFSNKALQVGPCSLRCCLSAEHSSKDEYNLENFPSLSVSAQPITISAPMLQQRIGVFVSYSHKDAAWLEELRPHLKALARKRKLELGFWDDTMIEPGTVWRDKLDAALNSARGAILLVSKYFLDSDFILDHELPQLRAAADAKLATLFSVILSPCRFDDLPELSRYQTVNPPSRTLEGMPRVEYEKVFVQLTEKLEDVLLGGKGTAAVSQVETTGEPRKAPSLVGGKERREELLPATPEGWQRILVRGEANGDLTFLVITGGRRAEARITAAQIGLADQFIREAVNTAFIDPNVGKTLFELLVPNDFKNTLFQADGTLLVLDQSSARFPWELMFTGEIPVAINTPIIRELPTTQFRPREACRAGRALVIGDPIVESPFAELPGAAAEARKVASALKQTGTIDVRESIGDSAFEILTAVFSETWQIFHFAGHAVVDYTPAAQTGAPLGQAAQKLSGLVLGNDAFFTGAEVEQMRAVPDLVFLNAAHAGAIRGVRPDAGTPDPHRSAATLATQFAILGSRAVIAPAWTIDDSAAITFAVEFYTALLRGEPFAKSMLAARKRTYEQHPQLNTWAAYQCYGDASFVLSPASDHDTNTVLSTDL